MSVHSRKYLDETAKASPLPFAITADQKLRSRVWNNFLKLSQIGKQRNVIYMWRWNALVVNSP